MDLTVWFEGGRIQRLEQDTRGDGCVDLAQWFDADERAHTEHRDSDGNCETDLWSYYEQGRLVRQGLDTQGWGKPNALNHFDTGGTVKLQELASGENGRNPDKKLFLSADGAVTAQCLLNEAGDRLDARAIVQNGAVTEVLIDTSGNGWADTREVLAGGQLARVDADTNGDRKPDVIQTFRDGALAHQDEDTDHDGVIDQRFEGDRAVAVPAGTRVQGARFGKLGCGSFHRFWWHR